MLAIRLLRIARPSRVLGPAGLGPASSHRFAMLLEPGTRVLIRTAPYKQQRPHKVAFAVYLVEAAGIEPASVSPLPSVLHV